MEETALVNQAVLGEQLDQFWRSEVGQYLLAKVEQECIMALEHLATADPSDINTMRDHQSTYKRAMSFKTWIENGIVAGLKAVEILEEREE